MINNVRKYGNRSLNIVLVHGGPGAPGEMAPIAKKLSKKHGVLEPFQTKNSVKHQVDELKTQIIENAKIPVILVGWSWGAWLSFILTAKHPKLVKKLILISSGPFESKYAKNIMPTRLNHLTIDEADRVKTIIDLFQKGSINNKLFEEFGILISKADSYDLNDDKGEKIKVQSDIYENVWKEADKLRRNGKLLKYGNQICCPVVVIHGDYDPHPFEGVKQPLSKVINNCKFVLLKNCGHTPWKEKHAKTDFYETLEKELETAKL